MSSGSRRELAVRASCGVYILPCWVGGGGLAASHVSPEAEVGRCMLTSGFYMSLRGEG